MNRKIQTPPAVGGSTLLTVFALLCLTVVALLSLTTARAELRLSDAYAAATAAYYEADARAQAEFARLRAEAPEDGVFAFEIPISDTQTLAAEVERREGQWYVRQWRTVAQELTAEDNTTLWNGGKP